MFTDLNKFWEIAESNINEVNEFANQLFSPTEVSVDHICYKCSSSDSFLAIRTIFESESAFIYQSIISGRRIAYIKFSEPFPTKFGNLSFLELSDQKPDGSQQDGFDHIEIYPTSISYEEMVDKLKATTEVIHVERPHYVTDDVILPSGFTFRCTTGPLVKKISAEEMR